MYLTYSSHCIFYCHVYAISSHWFIKIIRSPAQHFTYLQIPDKFQKAILEWKFTPKYSSTSTAETEKKKTICSTGKPSEPNLSPNPPFLKIRCPGIQECVVWEFSWFFVTNPVWKKPSVIVFQPLVSRGVPDLSWSRACSHLALRRCLWSWMLLTFRIQRFRNKGSIRGATTHIMKHRWYNDEEKNGMI